jgi:tyrosine-protein phosphatase non-receptor type 4
VHLLPQLNGVVPHDNLVLIKIKPDEHGRFGFNVKVSGRLLPLITYINITYGFVYDCTAVLSIVLLFSHDVAQSVLHFLLLFCDKHCGCH